MNRLRYYRAVHAQGASWWAILRYVWALRSVGPIKYHDSPEHVAEDLMS